VGKSVIAQTVAEAQWVVTMAMAMAVVVTIATVIRKMNTVDGEQNDYWMSLFDPRIVQVLNEIHTLSMLSDDDDDHQSLMRGMSTMTIRL
jgi:hypothetical protein